MRRFLSREDIGNIWVVCYNAFIEHFNKMFKEIGVKAFIGEEIQKDFFEEAPHTTEMDEKTRELLLNLHLTF